MQTITALLDEALALCQSGQLDEGQKIYLQILEREPANIKALSNLASIAMHNGNLDQSIALFKTSLSIDSNQPIAHYNYGMALQKANEFENALTAYDAAIQLNTKFVQAYNNRGLSKSALKRHEHALADFHQALALNPDYAEAHNNRGLTHSELKQHEDALEDYAQALALNPNYAQAYSNRALTLDELRRYAEALADYAQAIALNPKYAEAYSNRGLTLMELKRFDEALADFAQAISLNPEYAEAYSNRGLTLTKLKRFDEALADYAQAIALNPEYAEAHNNRGITYSELNRFDQALASHQRAFQLKPEIDYLLGSLLHTKMHLCDWDNLNPLLSQLTDAINKQERGISPFITLGLIDNPALQKQVAEKYVQDKYPAIATHIKVGPYPTHKKIRIGYFSADFRNHPVAFLTAELFELHDRDQFEVIAFSFGANTHDLLRQRLEGSFDQFIDVKDRSDAAIAELAREMKIDIAVDLGGFTKYCRVAIFAMRAAPIQISYIGYLGTMGADYFDYLVADACLISQDKQQYYAEKIVYLPSYQVNDRHREIADKVFTRKEVGLPDQAFVFCCFNNIYKITPATFDSWMRILKAVDNSVLWLLDPNQTASNNLKKEAAARGVDANRLIFGKPLPSPEYLARYRVADLFLDTLPYNAGTTASDALRVGLPVLTQMGESFASRMAASLLNAVGLPELITATATAYEALAIAIANNPPQLQAIKNTLQANLPNALLYNTPLFTQHLEQAYQAMHQRSQQGLAPDHIVIAVNSD
jgi:predicted O-linked N-acetylglucosamine transferase (SPINDLY family)